MIKNHQKITMIHCIFKNEIKVFLHVLQKRAWSNGFLKTFSTFLFQEKNTVEFYIYMHKMHPQLGGYHNNVHYNQCTTSFISPMSLSNESFREKSPERQAKCYFPLR